MAPEELASPAGRERYARLRGHVFEPASIRPVGVDQVGGFASANALGDDGAGMHHMGHCMIVDGRGVVLAQIPGNPVAAWRLDQMVHAMVEVP